MSHKTTEYIFILIYHTKLTLYSIDIINNLYSSAYASDACMAFCLNIVIYKTKVITSSCLGSVGCHCHCLVI